MDVQNRVQTVSIEPGELVYDSDSRVIGRVSGLTTEGFEAEEMAPDVSEVEEVPGKEFGEGYLMWRCSECGEMDELEGGLPGACPNCSAPVEAITAVEED